MRLFLAFCVALGCRAGRQPLASAVAAARRPSPSARVMLDQAEASIRRGNLEEAARLLGRVAVTPQEKTTLDRAVSLRASLAAYRGDYEAAAKTLLSHLKGVHARHDDPSEFYLHNALMMLREAQGD